MIIYRDISYRHVCYESYAFGTSLSLSGEDLVKATMLLEQDIFGDSCIAGHNRTLKAHFSGAFEV